MIVIISGGLQHPKGKGGKAMTQPKMKSRISKKTGHFICGDCRCEVGLGVILNGFVYCLKCGEIRKGIRDANGKLVNQGGQ